jgi:hypothetical protein
VEINSIARKPSRMNASNLSVFFAPRFALALAHKDLFLGRRDPPTPEVVVPSKPALPS